MNLARRSLRGTIVVSALVYAIFVSMIVFQTPPSPVRLDDAKPVSRWRFSYWEKCFMRRVNRARSRHGRGRLDWDKQLGYVARRHATRMAKNRAIWHDDVGNKVTRWRRLGQNTGRGRNCPSLERAFMNSYSHRHNILGYWRHIGVGTRWKNGRLYVQMVFESRRDPGNVWHYP